MPGWCIKITAGADRNSDRILQLPQRIRRRRIDFQPHQIERFERFAHADEAVIIECCIQVDGDLNFWSDRFPENGHDLFHRFNVYRAGLLLKALR